MTTDTERLATALADRYRIEKQLGAGGMATVYLATDLKHDREVALKVLRPELGAVLGDERFLAEIKITAKLDHPHILTLIDSGVASGYLYYVLPLVRGESLREKLNKEKQLGLEEAVAITRQVASALDYAHRHGVVHRDIKPENILLQEGEAMLTDFGIALAVKEAGGNRLTETGLSLGTPMYMSPEQATGDRMLDARSDVYSLAAVLYEMLAGEPPVTGPTAQAMIAKLMTERPTHLRVVRPSVPEAVDAAVARALDKTPADRFPSAGDFARAIEVKPAPAAAPAGRRVGWPVTVGGLGVVLFAGLGFLLATGRLGASRAPAFALRDRTQLTFTGKVYASAITPDGKQLAYITRDCAGANCSYAVEIQDVGGTATHRVLEGATAAYGLEWAPDRRNLIFWGSLKGRWGTHLLSALGGNPRYLSPGGAMFWAGGDSLLVAPQLAVPDSVFYARVTTLGGVVTDSIRVAGPGVSLSGISVMPSGRWIVALVVQSGRGLWQVFDRSGKVADRVINSCTCQGRITNDALWLTRSGDGSESIVRMGIDPQTGRLATRQDTLLSGLFNNFSVTADGGTLVIDDGTTDDQLWAVSLADALANRFAADRRRVQSSTRFPMHLSPDGSRILVGRPQPTSTGQSQMRYFVMPFDGGTETALNLTGSPRYAWWTDSVTVAYRTQTATGMRLSLVDIRTGQPSGGLDVADSLASNMTPVAGGWAWIPSSRDRIVVERDGKRSEVAVPSWFGDVFGLDADRSGTRVVATGWNTGTNDSVGVAVVPLDGGTPAMWSTAYGEGGGGQFLDDGSVLFHVRPTQESVTLIQLRGPGQARRLGTLPRPVAGLSVSDDLKRALVVERSYRGDAWMSRIVRP